MISTKDIVLINTIVQDLEVEVDIDHIQDLDQNQDLDLDIDLEDHYIKKKLLKKIYLLLNLKKN